MASEKVTQLIDSMNGLSVLELRDLKEALKEAWGVTAAVAMPMGVMGGGGGGEAAPVAEEQTEFSVILKDAGAQKIQVIKAVREVVPALGLKEAKDLVEAAPATVKDGITKDEADKMKEKLEAAGASIEIK